MRDEGGGRNARVHDTVVSHDTAVQQSRYHCTIVTIPMQRSRVHDLITKGLAWPQLRRKQRPLGFDARRLILIDRDRISEVFDASVQARFA